MRDDVGHIAVNVEPRQRVGEHVAMQNATAAWGRGGRVAHSPLERQQVLKAFDIPTGQRQRAEFRHRRSLGLVGGFLTGRPRGRSRRPQRDAQRHQKTAE